MNRILTVVLLCSMACAQIAATDTSPDATALLPELPPMPEGRASLIGGRISNLDRVLDQITVQIFGGSSMKVLFDGRTHIYRDGIAASYRDLQNGQRVYLDTVLDRTQVFAENIRIVTQTPLGESSGQVVSFEPGKGDLIVRDTILPEPLRLQVTSSTQFLRDGQPVSPAELQPGALVAIKLRPEGGGKGLAREISILAAPGSAFVFAGRVIHLDLHTGLLVLMDPRDKKSYEIHFDPARIPISNQLQQGADVTTTADFDGSRYTATSIMVSSPSGK